MNHARDGILRLALEDNIESMVDSSNDVRLLLKAVVGRLLTGGGDAADEVLEAGARARAAEGQERCLAHAPAEADLEHDERETGPVRRAALAQSRASS